MKLLISCCFLLLFYHKVSFSKEKLKPTLQSYICGKKCLCCGCTSPWDYCKEVYIYQYPKNIDKMIKENPDFKGSITKETKYSSLFIDCYGDLGFGLVYYQSKNGECNIDSKKIQEININSCYNLWKYNPYHETGIQIRANLELEQYCNEIIKKILNKTGKLY